MITSLSRTTFKRTNARGTEVGIRIGWVLEDQDEGAEVEEVFISWQRDFGSWTKSAALTAPPFEIVPAEPGTYVFQILSQVPGQTAFDYGYHEFAFDGLPEAEEEIPRPTGLELLGTSGELLGSQRTFTGRDLRLRWNSLRADALQMDGLGEQAQDQLLEQTVIRVYDVNGDLLRREFVPISLTEWVYTYAHATEDIPLTADPASVTRTLRLEVSFLDTAGRESIASLLNVEWTLRLSATADLDIAAAREFALFTQSSSFTLLDADEETETYGPATATVFDANAVVRVLIRIAFDMRAEFPSDPNSSTKAQVFFTTLRRPVGGMVDTTVDEYQNDMHFIYPQFGTTRGRINLPSFTVQDTPGQGNFEYRVRVRLNIAQGGASTLPILEFQVSQINMEVDQSKR